MKHAILIMAHKNYSFLHHLIEYFERDCYVFVHIDKKSDITKEEIACLREMPQVTEVYQKYSVHWGGFSILKCELFMLKDAMKKCDAEYFHLISGQDYPIKPLKVFLYYFYEHRTCNFLEYQRCPVQQWVWDEQWRYRYFLPFDRVDARSPDGGRKISKWINQQKMSGFFRSLPNQFPLMFKGSQWFSVTRDSAELLIEYSIQKPSFLKRMQNTFAPEETYVVTVLINLLSKATVVNDNLRYIRWKGENGSNPSILGVEHFEEIAQSNAFFARKMCSPYSDSLKEMICKYLLGK